jgi:Spy/CpxP family protein refolding chaperone
MMLVGIKEVAAELKITEAQEQKLRKVLEERMAQARPSQGEAPDMEKARQLMEKAEADMLEILDPAQEKRLKELSLQRRGAMALMDADLQKELGLSSGQTIALEKVAKDLASAVRPPTPREGGEPGAPREADGRTRNEGQRPDMSQWRKARESAEKRMLDVLTPAQKARFEAMKGKPFAFPQRQRGGGGAAQAR